MRERELLAVVIEVLSAVTVDLEDGHRVVKVGVPRGGEVHDQRQVLIRFGDKLALQ